VIHEKIADPKDVDTIFKMGFGHKMGPLATADLIGLDTIHNSLMVLYENYKDPKYKPCPLLEEMIKAGYSGKKSRKSLFLFKRQ
jgi:3-hydroxybutyryl-CoA dehydrogenase